MTTRQAGGIALVLLVVAMLFATAFRCIELLQERRDLTQQHDLQDKPVREVVGLRQRVDALVVGIADLAASGDSGAQFVLEELRRQGISAAAHR
ncbi:MAG TPA: hypothetical protein VHW90_10875 [Stellaceae bacterium]|jgi:hypothetical protein|nr:hypothetical protein [Stellaceae bacterium]